MAAGDLVAASPRLPAYEYNGVLYGNAPSTGIMVETVDGLDDQSDVKDTDLSRDDDHGSVTSPLLLDRRRVLIKAYVVSDFGVNVETVTEAIKAATLIQSFETKFVFKRPGWADSRFLWARTTKRSIQSSYERSKGLVTLTLELTCDDPVIRSLTTVTTTQKIPDGQHTEVFTVNVGGSYETPGVFTITGPCTNPRIGISSQVPLLDGTRYDDRATNVGGTQYAWSVMALDLVMNAGDTLVIDRYKKTVTYTPFGGAPVNRYSAVRVDNRWWNLLPGPNQITFSESGSAGVGATLSVARNDAWA